MLRFVLLFVVAMAIVAIVTRSPRVRRVLWVLFCILGVYAVLKLTGVVEALAPNRDGAFQLGYYNTLIVTH